MGNDDINYADDTTIIYNVKHLTFVLIGTVSGYEYTKQNVILWREATNAILFSAFKALFTAYTLVDFGSIHRRSY